MLELQGSVILRGSLMFPCSLFPMDWGSITHLVPTQPEPPEPDLQCPGCWAPSLTAQPKLKGPQGEKNRGKINPQTPALQRVPSSAGQCPGDISTKVGWQCQSKRWQEGAGLGRGEHSSPQAPPVPGQSCKTQLLLSVPLPCQNHSGACQHAVM